MTIDLLTAVDDLATSFFKEEKAHPVLQYASPQELRDTIDLSIPKEGKDFGRVMERLRLVILATPKTSSNRFFNQLFGGRISAATVADMLTSVINNSMYTYKVAGIQVLIELEVLRRFCDIIGFPEGEGTFAPGGSISNLVAMIVARNEKQGSIRNEGFDGKRYIVYTSDQSHYSIPKNAGIIGVGRRNVRMIASDNRGKLIVPALVEAIEADLLAGYTPFFINATAGTTVAGAFDPIEEMARVAREFGLWLHVDGAWGGSVLLSNKLRHLVKGCHLADSYSLNAHKMMNVSLTASAILLRKKGLLEKHFSEQAGYLFQMDNEYNPGRKSIQCGRRNDALKVWAAWQYHGDEGYERRVNKLYDLARYASETIGQHESLHLGLDPESMNICFQVKGKSSEKICTILDREGLIKVGHGEFKGDSYIRLICVNPDLTESDIDVFFEEILDVANRV